MAKRPTAKKRRRSKFSQVRHPFHYRVEYPATGKHEIRTVMVKVVLAKKPVTIMLQEAHVRKSIKLDGVGNTSTCSAAICATDHASAFPHAVEGHIDFQYTRAFVATKVDKIGLPAQCVAYEHECGDVAKLNDTVGGQQLLLDKIARDGPIEIKLLPYRKRSEKGRPGRSRKSTGVRKNIPAKGSNLRYAVMKLGAYPNKT